MELYYGAYGSYLSTYFEGGRRVEPSEGVAKDAVVETELVWTAVWGLSLSAQ